MKTPASFLALLPVLLLAPAAARAAEHAVPCNTLPAAVQQKSKAVLEGSRVRGCVRDVSGGKTTYEIETTKDNRSKDITFAADGSVLEVEEEVEMSTLPASTSAALQKKAAGGTFGKIESLARGGTIVSYEAVVVRNGKRQEIAVHVDNKGNVR